MSQGEALPPLSSAMEDYLEAIYHLEQERRIARVRDIAKKLGVKMSSVSSALRSLGSRGLIRYDPHQFITLTDRGIQKAREIVRKHEVLHRFLVRVLQIDPAVAEDNACRIEHYLDPEVIDKLTGFVEFMEMCPVDQTRWMESISQSCDSCKPCLDAAMKKLVSRTEAQKAALKEGMTLAEATAGAQIMVDSVKGTAKFKKTLAEDGLEAGTIVEVEKKDSASGTLDLNIKGYHIALSGTDAAKVLVKPI
jgi:DtxR family transcriptional regulator, Mn-dependent transcriptional regulator